MDPQHHAKLLELVAARGEKGFSAVVAEAIESYRKAEAQRQEQRRRALDSGDAAFDSVQPSGSAIPDFNGAIINSCYASPKINGLR